MPEIVKRNFTSGELSPSLYGRVDLKKYQAGVATAKNFFVHPEGGVSSRPGFEWVGRIKSEAFKLVPFRFNTEQAYILEFTDLAMRVIKDGGYITESSVVVTDITNAVAGVVTAPSHGYVNGDDVFITGVLGMLEVNGSWQTIANATADTFEIGNTSDYTVYSSGGTSARIYTVASPFSASEVGSIKYTQSADVMTIVHPDHDVTELSRIDHSSWSFDLVSYFPTVLAPEWAEVNSFVITGTNEASPANTMITVASTTGLSAGDYVFIGGIAGEVGGVLNGNSYPIKSVLSTTFVLVGAYTAGMTYVSGGIARKAASLSAVGSGGGSSSKTYRYILTAKDATGAESLPSASASITCSSLSDTFGVALEWIDSAGAESYSIYKEVSNLSGIYGWIGDSQTSEFEDYNIAPDSGDAPPADQQPFDGINNKPSVVGYYQQRIMFASTNNKLETVFTSQTGNYHSMRTSSPSKDDDAITFTIASQQVNEIRHIVSLDALILLTSGGEWLVSEGQSDVLTPSSVGVKPQSYYGASEVQPVLVGKSAVYIQERGTRVRDVEYTFESDSYSSGDLSLLAQHLFKNKSIVDLAYAQEPYSSLYVLRNDGVLLNCNYRKEHEVVAWSQFITDGLVKSIAVIPEGSEDVLYAGIERTINGNTVYYTERLKERNWEVSSNVFCVDAGSFYSGAVTSKIYGLHHLEGESISVVSDGNVNKNLTVTNGAVDLPEPASNISFGIPYICDLETLNIDTPDATAGSVIGKKKSVSQVVLKFIDSRGGHIGKDGDNLTEIKPRYDSDGYEGIKLKSYEQRITIGAGWSEGGRIFFRQSDPLPVTILAISPETSIG